MLQSEGLFAGPVQGRKAKIEALAFGLIMIIWPWQVPSILRKLMADVARLDEEILALITTFDAELAQFQAELAKPRPDLSAQVAKLAELRQRIASVIPDPVVEPGLPVELEAELPAAPELATDPEAAAGVEPIE